MLNYEIDPAILQSFVPIGTELDSWQGSTFVSMVGFPFGVKPCEETDLRLPRCKVLGWPVDYNYPKMS